jgi:hypothetical protein
VASDRILVGVASASILVGLASVSNLTRSAKVLERIRVRIRCFTKIPFLRKESMDPDLGFVIVRYFKFSFTSVEQLRTIIVQKNFLHQLLAPVLQIITIELFLGLLYPDSDPSINKQKT